MTFLAWLRKQADRDDAVGDFAADTMRLKKRPYNGDLAKWEDFLTNHFACPEAKEALQMAWKEYSATLRS